jgi:hypothetical protein
MRDFPHGGTQTDFFTQSIPPSGICHERNELHADFPQMLLPERRRIECYQCPHNRNFDLAALFPSGWRKAGEDVELVSVLALLM